MTIEPSTKKCQWCNETKPLEKFSRWKNRLNRACNLCVEVEVKSQTRKCKTCHTVKPFDSFYKSPSCKHGIYHDCKPCYNKNKYKYKGNTEERSRKNKAQHARRGQFKSHKDSVRSGHLMRKFGISLSDYGKLLEKQNHKCAICNNVQLNKRLAVDHCHTTGKVRGLLCTRCNVGIGYFCDNPTRLTNAAQYLSNL